MKTPTRGEANRTAAPKSCLVSGSAVMIRLLSSEISSCVLLLASSAKKVLSGKFGWMKISILDLERNF